MSFGRSLAASIARVRAPKAEQANTENRVLMPFGPWHTSPASAAGVYVSPDSATQLLAVYGCVSLISDTISTLPLDVYRDATDGQKDRVKSGLPKWLKNPNPRTTFIEFINQTIVSLLLEGNAYWLYSLDGNGMPAELYAVDPCQMDVRQESRALDAPVVYRLNGEIYRGPIVHIKGITRPGALKGISPVENARQSIGLGIAGEEFAARFYGQGATLSGVIETPNDLTLDQARDMVRKFAGDHAGLRNSHRPGLIDNGASWKPLSVSPAEAQFLESRQYSTAEICSQLFLVSPSWFGVSMARGSNVTYQNLEQDGERFAQFTCARWIVRLERAISDLLPQPQYCKFNIDELKRADLAARQAYYTAALDPVKGWMERAEVRNAEDLGRDPKPVAPPAPVVQLVQNAQPSQATTGT